MLPCQSGALWTLDLTALGELHRCCCDCGHVSSAPIVQTMGAAATEVEK